MDDEDFMAEISKAAPPKKKTSRSDIQTGFGGKPVDLREKVHKAADTGHSKKHGRFVQFTMRLDEETVKEMKSRAQEIGITDTQMYRWVVDRGLKALADGERPEIEYRQVPSIVSPK